MSKNSEFFTMIREEEYDDYRQDELYVGEQKWQEEEEYWNSLKKKAVVIDGDKENNKETENHEELSEQPDTLPFP